jgi:hypothetical protein
MPTYDESLTVGATAGASADPVARSATIGATAGASAAATLRWAFDPGKPNMLQTLPEVVEYVRERAQRSVIAVNPDPVLVDSYPHPGNLYTGANYRKTPVLSFVPDDYDDCLLGQQSSGGGSAGIKLFESSGAIRPVGLPLGWMVRSVPDYVPPGEPTIFLSKNTVGADMNFKLLAPIGRYTRDPKPISPWQFARGLSWDYLASTGDAVRKGGANAVSWTGNNPGTGGAPILDRIEWKQYSTGGASAAQAYIISWSRTFIDMSRPTRWIGLWRSPTTPAAGLNLWVGIFGALPAYNATLPTTNAAFFRYCPAGSVDTTAFFRAITHDNAGSYVTTTTAPYRADTVYIFEIRTRPELSPPRVEFYVNGWLAATHSDTAQRAPSSATNPCGWGIVASMYSAGDDIPLYWRSFRSWHI